MPIYYFFDQDLIRLDHLHRSLADLFSDFDQKYSPFHFDFRFHHGPFISVDQIDLLICFTSSYGDFDLIPFAKILIQREIRSIYADLTTEICKKINTKIELKSESGFVFSPTSGEMVLPVGSAILCDLTPQHSVICAPISEVPRSLKFDSLMNVYYAMIAVIHLTHDLGNDFVVVLPLIPDGEDQIVRAFRDVLDGRKIEYPDNVKIQKNEDYYLVSPTFLF